MNKPLTVAGDIVCVASATKAFVTDARIVLWEIRKLLYDIGVRRFPAM